LTVIFSGVDVPGESEYKIFEFIRRKCQEPNFNPNTTICIFGKDPNLLMLGLIPHLPFICILHEHSQPQNQRWLANKQHQQTTYYDFEWINVLRDYLEIEFSALKDVMGERYNLDKIIDDFVFLNLFLSNKFLPRIFCMNVKIENLDKILEIFKENVAQSDGYINNKGVIAWDRAILLFQKIAQFELKFINDKLEEQAQANLALNYKKNLDEVDTLDIQSNQEAIQEVNELTEDYEEYEKSNQEEMSIGSDSDEEGPPLSVTKRKIGFSTPRKSFHIRPGGKKSIRTQGDIYKEDLVDSRELDQSNSSDSTSKSDNEKKISHLRNIRGVEKEEDKQYNEQSLKNYRSDYSDSYLNEMVREYKDRNYNLSETFSRYLSADVLENDTKFLGNLVKLYKKNKIEASRFYYKEKFNIQQENPDDVKEIVYSYFQGLQFVLSYYYVECPSWKWLYNYHYSPLLLDLVISSSADYVHFVKKAASFGIFEKSKPSEPFKQLWYILPINQLQCLIPKSLNSIVCHPDSSLYKYHSLEFSVDPFGGISYYEYIGKVPFITPEQLDAEYEKAIQKCKLSEKEEARNSHGVNLVYEWNLSAQEIEVEAPQPSYYFDKIRVKVKISQFSFHDMPFDPVRILDKSPSGTFRYHKSFPSINFIQDKRIERKAFNLEIGTADRCCIRLGQRLNLTEYKQYRRLLDQPFYCMYPFLVPCFVMGVVTPDQLITNVNYKNLPFSYNKHQHQTYYTNLSLNVHQFYFIHMVFGDY